jgi:hypothetical protein
MGFDWKLASIGAIFGAFSSWFVASGTMATSIPAATSVANALSATAILGGVAFPIVPVALMVLGLVLLGVRALSGGAEAEKAAEDAKAQARVDGTDPDKAGSKTAEKMRWLFAIGLTALFAGIGAIFPPLFMFSSALTSVKTWFATTFATKQAKVIAGVVAFGAVFGGLELAGRVRFNALKKAALDNISDQDEKDTVRAQMDANTPVMCCLWFGQKSIADKLGLEDNGNGLQLKK